MCWSSKYCMSSFEGKWWIYRQGDKAAPYISMRPQYRNKFKTLNAEVRNSERILMSVSITISSCDNFPRKLYTEKQMHVSKYMILCFRELQWIAWENALDNNQLERKAFYWKTCSKKTFKIRVIETSLNIYAEICAQFLTWYKKFY